MSGYIYHKTDLKSTYTHIIGSALFIVSAIVAIYTSLSMDCKGSIVWLYYVIAICGTVATIQLKMAVANKNRIPIGLYWRQDTLYSHISLSDV